MTNKTKTEIFSKKDFGKLYNSFDLKRERLEKSKHKFFMTNFKIACETMEIFKYQYERFIKRDDKGHIKLSASGTPLVDNAKLTESLKDTAVGNISFLNNRDNRNNKTVMINNSVADIRNFKKNNPESDANSWYGLKQAEDKRLRKLKNQANKNNNENAIVPEDELKEIEKENENPKLAIRQIVGTMTASPDYHNLNTKQIDGYMKDILKALLKDNGINEKAFADYVKLKKKA